MKKIYTIILALISISVYSQGVYKSAFDWSNQGKTNFLDSVLFDQSTWDAITDSAGPAGVDYQGLNDNGIMYYNLAGDSAETNNIMRWQDSYDYLGLFKTSNDNITFNMFSTLTSTFNSDTANYHIYMFGNDQLYDYHAYGINAFIQPKKTINVAAPQRLNKINGLAAEITNRHINTLTRDTSSFKHTSGAAEVSAIKGRLYEAFMDSTSGTATYVLTSILGDNDATGNAVSYAGYFTGSKNGNIFVDDTVFVGSRSFPIYTDGTNLYFTEGDFYYTPSNNTATAENVSTKKISMIRNTAGAAIDIIHLSSGPSISLNNSGGSGDLIDFTCYDGIAMDMTLATDEDAVGIDINNQGNGKSMVFRKDNVEVAYVDSAGNAVFQDMEIRGTVNTDIDLAVNKQITLNNTTSGNRNIEILAIPNGVVGLYAQTSGTTAQGIYCAAVSGDGIYQSIGASADGIEQSNTLGGEGFVQVNSGASKGFKITHGSTEDAIEINNTSTGKSIQFLDDGAEVAYVDSAGNALLNGLELNDTLKLSYLDLATSDTVTLLAIGSSGRVDTASLVAANIKKVKRWMGDETLPEYLYRVTMKEQAGELDWSYEVDSIRRTPHDLNAAHMKQQIMGEVERNYLHDLQLWEKVIKLEKLLHIFITLFVIMFISCVILISTKK